MTKAFLSFFGAIALSTSGALAADEYMTGAIGMSGIGNGDSMGQAFVEYRSKPILEETLSDLLTFKVKPRPTIGASLTSDSSAYGYAGFNVDIPVAERWTLTPNWVVGAYSKGAGRDLGGALEFRSGLEASYELDSKARVGAVINHTSNADIYDTNPGDESLMFVYSHPVSFLD